MSGFDRTLAAGLLAVLLGTAACSSPGSPVPSPPPSEVHAGSPSATPIPASSVPDSIRLLCNGTTTVPAVPVVQARSDGVHVEVLNVSGEAVLLQVDEVGGTSAQIGLSTRAWEIPPGEARLRCQSPDLDAGRPEGWATVLVVDPAGHFAGARCPNGEDSTMIADYAMGAQGAKGAVIDVARRQNVEQPGDIVVEVGYGSETIAVIRAGRVIRIVKYRGDGSGGWLVDTVTTCA